MGWRNDIRLEMMGEAMREQGICQRCGAPLNARQDPDEVLCQQCEFDDWHEEIPDVLPQEGE